MLNKRGIGQDIDWIIGIGLFILSITFIFILFKPGIMPVFDSQTLLDITQDGFNNDTNWVITTVPIFIYPANDSFVGDGQLVLLSPNAINVSCKSSCSTTSDEKISNLVEDKDKTKVEFYYMRRTDADSPPSPDVDEEPVRCEKGVPICEEDGGAARAPLVGADEYPLKVDRPDQINYFMNLSGLYTDANLEAGIASDPKRTKYLLIVSNKQINYFLDEFDIDESILKACNSIDKDNWPYSDGVAEQCPVIYDFGITETTSGIDLRAFLDLTNLTGSGCSLGYDCVKTKWGFPASKEFNIKLENLPTARPTPRINYTFPERSIVPTNVNVFVRQFNDFVLTDDGTRIPVSVRITVW